MDRDRLLADWRREEREPFSGWDFGYLDGRMIEEQPPWDYVARASELMDGVASVLDMGTGGGERLLEMREHWPPTVVVTEEYAPNVALASERLGPLGVRVVDVPLRETGPMPFEDGEFDLVLNRHSGLNCAEVARILAPGGAFYTQQVHGLWAESLLAEFGARPQWPNATSERYVPLLESAGLQVITVEDWVGDLSFTDVGAIIYELKAVPWLVPGFAVDGYVDVLERLYRRIGREGRYVCKARKYMIEARKP